MRAAIEERQAAAATATARRQEAKKLVQRRGPTGAESNRDGEDAAAPAAETSVRVVQIPKALTFGRFWIWAGFLNQTQSLTPPKPLTSDSCKSLAASLDLHCRSICACAHFRR